MQIFPLIGAVLIVLGLAILYFLRNSLIRLIIFLLEFLGIFVGVLLVMVGIGMLFANKWVS